MGGPAPAFLDDDVLLSGPTARELYHHTARHAPIVDFHSHLAAADVAGDRAYGTLTELWLSEDHYTWRAMRLAGVDEALVTGGADPWDTFAAWASTMPRLVGNPLHLWGHLALRRVFGIDLALHPGTAREIWDEANRQLPRLRAQALLARFGVELLATTDDPGDDLAAHLRLRDERPEGVPSVVPTWRPDEAHRLLADPPGWNAWADRLQEVTGVAVVDLESLAAALQVSLARFGALGARCSDHGLLCVPDRDRDQQAADAAVRLARRGVRPAPEQRRALALEVVWLAARRAHQDGTVVQLHLGARRDVSPRILAAAGRDAGGDATADVRQEPGLRRLLAGLEEAGCLPRTVLYNLHPADGAVVASLAGAFSRPGVRGLVQWGPPWWFNDHEDGIRRHLATLSAVGQLGAFVGMVTDSRSILSMVRHEVFRRVLCDVVGRQVDEGRLPAGGPWLSQLVGDVCAGNARRYLGIEPPSPERPHAERLPPELPHAAQLPPERGPRERPQDG